MLKLAAVTALLGAKPSAVDERPFGPDWTDRLQDRRQDVRHRRR